jgi:hypothetical protein
MQTIVEQLRVVHLVGDHRAVDAADDLLQVGNAARIALLCATTQSYCIERTEKPTSPGFVSRM